MIRRRACCRACAPTRILVQQHRLAVYVQPVIRLRAEGVARGLQRRIRHRAVPCECTESQTLRIPRRWARPRSRAAHTCGDTRENVGSAQHVDSTCSDTRGRRRTDPFDRISVPRCRTVWFGERLSRRGGNWATCCPLCAARDERMWVDIRSASSSRVAPRSATARALCEHMNRGDTMWTRCETRTHLPQRRMCGNAL